MRSVEERLTDLSQLESGWYGDGEGESVLPETIETARWLVPLLQERYSTNVFIYPTLEGGLSLEWSTENKSCSLEILQTDVDR